MVAKRKVVKKTTAKKRTKTGKWVFKKPKMKGDPLDFMGYRVI